MGFFWASGLPTSHNGQQDVICAIVQAQFGRVAWKPLGHCHLWGSMWKEWSSSPWRERPAFVMTPNPSSCRPQTGRPRKLWAEEGENTFPVSVHSIGIGGMQAVLS